MITYCRKKQYKMTIIKATTATPKMSIKNQQFTYYNAKKVAILLQGSAA